MCRWPFHPLLGLAVWLCSVSWSALCAEPARPSADTEIRVIDVAGQVEVAREEGGAWRPLKPAETLRVGDRVRTGVDSRATLQFRDRSVFRLNQSSVLEVHPPAVSDGRKSLWLRFGELFFFDRERPSQLELRTPTTTSAIRGTEFLLEVAPADGTTRLALLDGAVTVAAVAGGAPVELTSGQQVTVRPGVGPEVSPLLEARLAIQWCFHYPGVVYPPDAGINDADLERLRPALEAYRTGDLLGAVAALPGPEVGGVGARIFAAGVRLAAGQVAALEGLPENPESGRGAVTALRRLVATVRGGSPGDPPSPSPSTASECLAASYHWQARSRLAEALEAARRATELAPDFGFAWIRVAELEWSHGRARAAEAALARGREWSPRNPMAAVLGGYLRLAGRQFEAAQAEFEAARALDGSLADVWVGLGLVAQRRGDRDEALRCFQLAAAIEPQRAVLRSYLGKAWSATGDDARADREFGLALGWDPADPTGWFYRGLHEQQTHRFNASVRDLEESVARNDGHSVFRSSLRLDEDLAMRRADLAVSYAAVGLGQVAERAASRAIADDYTDFAGHLFRARTFQALEDPARLELRWEAVRQSELLVANLLAPADGANLSQLFSEQDRLAGFEGRSLGGTSWTEYRSTGDWTQAGSLYGTVGRLGYALDGRYASINGDRPNAEREESEVTVTAKQGVGDRDEIYVQGGWLRREGGDLSRLVDPEQTIPGYHFEEDEAPFAYVGYHRAWTPDSHTLALVSHVEDRLQLRNPQPEILARRNVGGIATSLRPDPFFDLDLDSRFQLTTAELQQIWRWESHTFVAGVRGQIGDLTTEQTLVRENVGTLPTPRVRPDYSDLGGYVYDTWKLWKTLRLTAGVSFDDVTFPRNAVWAPVGGEEAHRTQWSPKFGLEYSPWTGGHFRGAYAQGVGGQDFATSIRLEPAEVAGFPQIFRTLAPASSVGVLTGLRQEMAGVGFDQAFPSGTYLGVTVGRLVSNGDRELGIVENSDLTFMPDRAASVAQRVEYQEDALDAYAVQLLGDRWATGLRYALSRSDLTTSFPGLSMSLPEVRSLSADTEATLGQLELFLMFQHESGLYAGWATDWYHQQTSGVGPVPDDEDFWQHQVWVGYRLPHRRADLRVGIVNLTDQNYRLNPLNEYREPPRERTVEVRLRINF